MIRQNYSVLALACCALFALTGCGGSSNKDVTIPVISLEGSASVSLEAGAAYTDAGATATDNIDGAITGSIVTVNPVDINTVGTYTVTYNVTDAAGNAATAVTRMVEVVEPVLSGVFADSAVEGLTYTTATQSGVTDASGTFQYQAGESVVFSIGTFQLGESATAAAEMTPLDLISGAVLPTTFNELLRLALPGRQSEPDAVAFRKLSNLLVLLQALDSDKDASNGITIADGMGAIIDSVTIDITMNFDDFKRSTALIELMNAAVTGDLISSGFIKEPGAALNHFYEAQSTPHSFKALQARSTDSNDDGTANAISTYTHDTNGDMLTWNLDTNADGAAEFIFTFTYDANGNTLVQSSDTNGDGTANQITYNTYDANGYKLTESVDSNADGTANTVTTNTYNDKGETLTESVDTNADGIANSIRTYTYNSANNLTLVSFDSDADGSGDNVSSFTSDANGNTLTQIDDTNNDGTPDNTFTFTYDANGNYLTQSYDTNGDGTANKITTNTYDANGNQLTQSYDTSADGTANGIYTYTYDSYGNQLTDSYDTNGDGTANEIITNTYDATGELLTVSVDSNGDGATNSSVSHTFDDATIGYAFKRLENL